MDRDKIAAKFYTDDHALLFALIARATLMAVGESGMKAIESGVKMYGWERGLRYAMRCLKNGDDLSVANYMAYSELLDVKGWNRSVNVSLTPFYHFDTVACGWCDTWKKYNIQEYGKLYCNWIDVSLVHGFNPDIILELDPIMSHGSETCSFKWKNFAFKDEAEAAKVAEKRKQLLPGVGKDFLYHCGHLLAAMRRGIHYGLGAVAGDKILALAMSEYAAEFGQDKLDAIVQEANQDFLVI
ncbi:L-2-amino-thiazoline-4-carboxylic acid hydrolase [Desulfovibrio sp. OttesenSCG-928-C06]|nr:L-2-amino-thiazoline-4-carboxylic acid hydrolase [Desulfovibrio sp. OttesenSCG-928-C06]